MQIFVHKYILLSECKFNLLEFMAMLKWIILSKGMRVPPPQKKANEIIGSDGKKENHYNGIIENHEKSFDSLVCQVWKITLTFGILLQPQWPNIYFFRWGIWVFDFPLGLVS